MSSGPDVVQRPGLGAVARILVDRGHRLRMVPVLQHCLVLVTEGVKEVHGEAGVLRVPAGSLIALSAGAMPTLDNLPDGRSGLYRATALAFDDACVAGFLRDGPAVRPPLRRAAEPCAVFDELLLVDAAERAIAALATPAVSDAVTRHRLYEVLLVLAELGVSWQPPGEALVAHRIRQMIAARPDAPWTAADAARLLDVSEPTLRRRLAGEGTSFRDLLAEVRLSHGLMLLQTSRDGIAEVALACGYDSPSRFAARFRERFGSAPSDVRSGVTSETG